MFRVGRLLLVPAMVMGALVGGAVNSGATTQPTKSSAPILKGLKGSALKQEVALIAQARKEKGLNWIDSIPLPSTGQDMFKAFEKEYGLKGKTLNYQRLSTTAVGTQVLNQLTSGQVTTDMLGAAYPVLFSELKSSNALLKYKSPNLKYYQASESKVSNQFGYWVSADSFADVPVVNPSKYSGTIKSWSDLLNPALKGKLLMLNCQASASECYAYIGLTKVMPKSFFTALAAQVGSYSVGSSIADTTAVAEGQDSVGICPGFRLFQTDAATGVTLQDYYPKEGVVMLGQSYGILAKSPDPAMAKLFQDFLLSAKGQSYYVDREGVLTDSSQNLNLPANITRFSPKSINSVKVIPMDWPTITAAVVATYTATFNQTFNP